MHRMHLPRFWKHKETNEVIDHLTYSDLKGKPESSDFNECDVTGNLLNQEAVAPIEATPTETTEVPVGKSATADIEVPPVEENEEPAKSEIDNTQSN